MAEEKFVSNVSSADFDAALTGGLAFSRGEWASDEQKAAFVEKVVEELAIEGVGLPPIVTLSGAEQSLVLDNATEYRCADAVTALTITGFIAGPEGQSELWSIQFVAGEGITVALPDSVVWNYGAFPVFTAGSEYVLVFTPLLSGKVLGVWNEVEA